MVCVQVNGGGKWINLYSMSQSCQPFPLPPYVCGDCRHDNFCCRWRRKRKLVATWMATLLCAAFLNVMCLGARRECNPLVYFDPAQVCRFSRAVFAFILLSCAGCRCSEYDFFRCKSLFSASLLLCEWGGKCRYTAAFLCSLGL
jgi:hypothetical protein